MYEFETRSGVFWVVWLADGNDNTLPKQKIHWKISVEGPTERKASSYISALSEFSSQRACLSAVWDYHRLKRWGESVWAFCFSSPVHSLYALDTVLGLILQMMWKERPQDVLVNHQVLLKAFPLAVGPPRLSPARSGRASAAVAVTGRPPPHFAWGGAGSRNKCSSLWEAQGESLDHISVHVGDS